MTPQLRWILAIVGLLGGNVVAMLVLMFTSSAHGAQVIPDYYERAAHYDRAIDQAAHSRALGWRIEQHGRRIRVVDAAGVPVERVTLAGYPRAHAARRFETPDSRLPDDAHGWCDIVVTAERGGDRFEQPLAVELP